MQSPPPHSAFELAPFLGACQSRVDEDLNRCLPPVDCAPSALHEAMRYAVFSGGKRLRPTLAFAAAQIWRRDWDWATSVASAVELVHAYSLVHDDLPAMDDDCERRGQPTVHIKFGHALGILTGDALLALAFERLSADCDPESNDASEPTGRLVGWLARAAGSRALVGGQVDDLAAASSPLSLADIVSIHRRKTAALFEFAVAGAALRSGGSQDEIDALREFADAYGLGFQAADDLADAGRSETSILMVCGPHDAREHLAGCVRRATAALERFGPGADALRALAESLLNRLR